MITRRDFLRATPAAFFALAQARTLFAAETDGPSLAALKPPKVGLSTRTIEITALKPARVTTASPKVCKLLQFTDMHFFHVTAAEDERTLADCRKQIERHQPDLVVVSGDIWHDNPEGKGQSYLEFAVKNFAGWGVPWTTCWGNHDLLDDYQPGHDRLETAAHSLYRGAGTHGDYRVEVLAGGAAANATPALDLFFLNSSADGLTPWQARALGQMTAQVHAARATAVPALLFVHIPILEYATMLKPDAFKGVKLEGVGNGKERGITFPVMTAAKTIRACFCGHNHTNDYVVKADTVDLNYGRSTGYAGYGGDKLRKGAKLIEVDLATGNYQQTTVFADGTKHFAMFAPTEVPALIRQG